MQTLRARLTWWNLLIVTVALTMFAVLLYVWLARTMYQHHDADLAADRDTLARLLAGTTDPLTALQAIDAIDTRGPILVLRDREGVVTYRSRQFERSDLTAGAQQALAHARATDAEPAYFTVRAPNGSVRFICFPLGDPAAAYLQIGRRLGEVEELLHKVAIASAVLVPLVIVLTSFGSLAVARRALMPIDQIGSTLESIQATDLSQRVQTITTDSELTRLSSSINRLLDRLQASFTAMRAYTSEVSHQLKTPLTVMKTAVQAAIRDGRPERVRQTLEELSRDIDALTATISDLRNYALADADSAPSGSDPINVSDVFMEAAEIIRALAEAREITCEISIEAGLRARANPVRLRQVVLNLGENAVQFTPRGGNIHIALRRDHEHVVLEIADTGSGIRPADMPHVFEQNFRARRVDGCRGSGLGLAIAKRIVEAHSGEITLTSAYGRGTRVLVNLPLSR
jgi:two-component system OmpR family sensor kinase